MDQLPERPGRANAGDDSPYVVKTNSIFDELLTVKAVYVLYLVGLLTGGVTSLIGVVIAYVQRANVADTSEWEFSHYQYQIRTFWIGFLYMAVGMILMVVLIGYLVWLFWLVWMVVRCVQGLQLSAEQKPIPNPEGWWFN